MSNPQNIAPALAQGFKGFPEGFQFQQQPQFVYNQPQSFVQPKLEQQMMPQPQEVANEGDSFNVFGQSIQKKYVYILGVLLLLAVGYFVWKWYSNKKQKDEDDDEEDEDEEDEGSDEEIANMAAMMQQNAHMMEQQQEEEN